MMLLAFVLFLADLKANTHGILSFGGVLALVLGMAFLVNTGPVSLGVNPIVAVAAAALTLAFFVLFVRKILQARRRPAFAGAEALVGATGEAREELAPEGLVFVRGALWKAVAANGPIPVGGAVQVVGRKGLQLEVVAGEAATMMKEKE
jgi:membrane-bound serine protease (ClpP class)